MVTALLSNQEVLSSIPGSAVNFFSSGAVFHSIDGLNVSEFQCPLSTFCVVYGGGSTLLATDERILFNCVCVPVRGT